MAVEPEWNVAECDPEVVRDLSESLDRSRLLASLLVHRGISEPQRAREFLEPTRSGFHDPASLPDISTAVARIETAIDRGEQVVVYADRDVDGICACTTLVKLLSDLGANAGWYVPAKYDGYGMSEEAVEELVERETDLIITVDCGTTASEEIRLAGEAGIDVVVTDHHAPDETEPPALACVNPRLSRSDYPNENLAAGALAYKVGVALVAAIAPDRREEFDSYALPLAAIATLGDYMHLTVENRAIAVEGFQAIDGCPLPGVTALVERSGVESIRDLSWSLVPLLNAAQEDESGSLPLTLLFTRDEGRRADIFDRLETYREQRKRQRAERRAHLRACYEDQVAPLAEDDLLVTVETEKYVGGAAMHDLSGQIGRPVVTYRAVDGGYSGGGRSDPDVDFIDLYEACAELLDDYWGHPGAAGFDVAATNLEAFLESLHRAVERKYSREEFVPTVDIDAVLQPAAITPGLVDDIDDLRPFGPGNDEPQFLLEDLEIGACETFGQDDEHLRLEPACDAEFRLVAWNEGAAFDMGPDAGPIDVVGTLEWNSFEEVPQVTISEYRAATD